MTLRVNPYRRIPMQCNLRHSDVKAFTLVEVMVAAGVMILALVGMIQVVVSGSEMLDVSRNQTVAMQIIHGQIDNIRLANWATITNNTAHHPTISKRVSHSAAVERLTLVVYVD